jgi:Ca-activated chloride channel family protein
MISTSPDSLSRQRPLVFGLVVLLVAIGMASLAACGGGCGCSGSKSDLDAASDTVTLVFTYSSEKAGWIEAMVERFHMIEFRTSSERLIRIRSIPMASEECIDEIVTERRRTHLTSPASVIHFDFAFEALLATSARPIFSDSRLLVSTPTVIAMWKPMAEALGWGNRPVGWSDLVALAGDPRGWGAYGHPEWGQFKFGHAHPEFSNSGLATVLGLAYAVTGKTDDLTIEDIRSPAVASAMTMLGGAVVQYGASTGFFGRKIVERGPAFLHAAVLYGNSVVGAYDQVVRVSPGDDVVPLVAIYPKEGTFLNENPIAIVDREWVTPEDREAARIFIDFLMEAPQQREAMHYGFRPTYKEMPLESPMDADHGVDAAEPRRILSRPAVPVIRELVRTWRANKKSTHLVFILDRSAAAAGRAAEIQSAAERLVSVLGARDRISVLAYGDTLSWIAQDLDLATSRVAALDALRAVPPPAGAGAIINDAIENAANFARSRQDPDRFVHLVVVTAGDNVGGARRFSDLMVAINSLQDSARLRVFTIGLGPAVNEFALERLAAASHALYIQLDGSSLDRLTEIEAYF